MTKLRMSILRYGFFWGEGTPAWVSGGKTDFDAELNSLVRSLEDVDPNNMAYLDRGGLSALRRLAPDWKDLGAVPQIEDEWDVRQITLSAGGQQVDLSLKTDASGRQAALDFAGKDPQKVLEMLSGVQGAVKDPQRREILGADLEAIRGLLKSTLEEAQGANYRLAGIVDDALTLNR